MSPTSACWHPHERVLAPEDELYDLVRQATAQYQASPSFEHFVKAMRDPRGDLSPQVGHIAHPASHLLNRLRCSGAPVTCQGTQWTFAQKAAALTRGPHQSASKHIPFLRQEFVDMIHKGQWTVLPARLVLHEPQLRLSPLDVVPQRDRRPRTISDYTFFGLNHETVPVSPSEYMQFGRALWRILRHIKSANPHHGPIYLSKIDIADSFYRIWVRASDVPKLGILFPAESGEEYLVGFPLALPMGWTESPKIFTAATETVADMTNASLKSGDRFPAHHLDTISETPPPPATLPPKLTPSLETPSLPPRFRRSDAPHYDPPLALWDVYVDDFLGSSRGGRRTRLRVERALLHSLDRVMRPLDSEDSPLRQESASVKKMGKGDATSTTLKPILGWIINTLDKMISLPPHRLVRFRDIINYIGPNQRGVALNKWQQVLGKLRSMALAIPAAIGLFSVLQEALKSSDGSRVRLTQHMHAFLQDFRWLVKDVGARPTKIDELIPDANPSTRSACDASGTGQGGVHFVLLPDGTTLPLLWRSRWPHHLSARLVSSSNPTPDVTNIELELAASVAHADVLAHAFDVRSHTTHQLSDNSATVAWQLKGAAPTTGPVAYLMRLQALHQRHRRYVPLHDFVLGVANVMADDFSRLFTLTDSQLLSHFNSSFPQTRPWQMFPPRQEMLSALTSALSKKRRTLGSLLNAPNQRMCIGCSGKSSLWKATSTLSCALAPTQSPSSRSSPSVTAMDASPPKAIPSGLEQWRTPSVWWARRSPTWRARTSGRTSLAKSTFASHACSPATKKKIPRLPE
jgi:hypothetical protein